VTYEVLFKFVGFVLIVLDAAAGAWWRIEARVTQSESRALTKADAAMALASMTQAQLSELHTAETHVTKAGMQEQTTQILRSIEGLGSRLDGVHERLGRVFEERSPARRSGQNM
jgi:hypothetical protein